MKGVDHRDVLAKHLEDKANRTLHEAGHARAHGEVEEASAGEAVAMHLADKAATVRALPPHPEGEDWHLWLAHRDGSACPNPGHCGRENDPLRWEVFCWPSIATASAKIVDAILGPEPKK